MDDTTLLEKKKEDLADKKRKIEMRERLLKEEERKVRAKALTQAGRLVEQADLLHLSHDELLGALLELSQRSKNATERDSWIQRSESYKAENETTPLIIVPAGIPAKELRQIMKSSGFRWNAFRKEWHGRGNLRAIKEATSDYNVTIEVVE